LYREPDQNEPGGPGSVYPQGWGNLCCLHGCVLKDGTPGNHILILAGQLDNAGLFELYTYPDYDPYHGAFNILKDASDPSGYLVDPASDHKKYDRRPEMRVEWAKLSDTKVLINGMLPPGYVLTAGRWLTMILDAHDDVEHHSTLTPTQPLNTPRTYACMANLPQGKVMIMCGQDPNGNLLNSCEVYDPNTNSWTVTGPMSTGRQDFAYCILADGRIAVFGGCDTVRNGTAGGKVLDTIEIYDPNSGVWTAAGSMLRARHMAQAVLLPDGTVLICGGKSIVAENSATAVIALAEIFAPKYLSESSVLTF
jgi:hypothetical protein